MPNLLDATGLQTATATELQTNFTASMQAIYGSTIDLSSNTPDGQMMNLFLQAVLDLEDLLVQIYNSMDPDNAIGVVLDQRVALNGIQRQGGTFTVTNITLTVSQALNLYGLDQTAQPIFTVADNAGNQWQLQTTQSISTPGAYVYSFQAANPGAVLTVPNTITVPVTIVLGVTSINNPTTYTTLGVNEESDAVLKVRRQQSVALASTGYYNGLVAALKNINGVTSAFVFENVTGATDANGVPGHSIWVIVAGTASASAIANAIYSKRNSGCGMLGAQSFVITQADGTSFTVFWDVVVSQNLYIAFTASSIDGINPPKLTQIWAQLPGIYTPGVNAEVNINQLATLVQQIDPNCLVTNAGFSASPSGPFTTTLLPSARNKQFVVLQANITILPVLLLPLTANVPRTSTQQFTAAGGTQTGYVYTLTQNQSGGNINASTGLYTAGAVTGTDIVQVTDSAGNSDTSAVTVT
jgi:hypothetical protein